MAVNSPYNNIYLSPKYGSPVDEIRFRHLSFTNNNWRSEAKRLTKIGFPIGFALMTRLLQYLTDQASVGIYSY